MLPRSTSYIWLTRTARRNCFVFDTFQCHRQTEKKRCHGCPAFSWKSPKSAQNVGLDYSRLCVKFMVHFTSKTGHCQVWHCRICWALVSGSPRPKPKPLFRPHTQICQYKGSHSMKRFTLQCIFSCDSSQCSTQLMTWSGARAGVTSRDHCVPPLLPRTAPMFNFQYWARPTFSVLCRPAWGLVHVPATLRPTGELA